MHVVLWTVAGQRYATRTEQIIEVIPPVTARPVPETPAWLRGLINYRGRLVPLLDVPRLLGHEDWPLRMASRILVVRISSEATNSQRIAALLVQAVAGSGEFEFTGEADVPHAASACGEFLGPMALTDAGVIQLTYPERIAWEI
jgi:chemotaxis signal transduction protein